MSEQERAGCAVMLVVAPVSMVLRVFAFVSLWTWFLMPLGAPTLTFAHAVGLDQIRALLSFPLSNPQMEAWVQSQPADKRSSIMLQGSVRMLFWPLLSLVTGWAVHAWAMP